MLKVNDYTSGDLQTTQIKVYLLKWPNKQVSVISPQIPGSLHGEWSPNPIYAIPYMESTWIRSFGFLPFSGKIRIIM